MMITVQDAAEALFASPVQPSDNPDLHAIGVWVSTTIVKLEIRGCASVVATEFGEHPDTAAIRMRWALDRVTSYFISRLDTTADDGDGEYEDETDPTCQDCGTNTAPCNAPPYTQCSPEHGCAHDGMWEWYMLTDETWAAIGNPGIMCIGCAEKRLGRQLHAGDFSNLPINDPHPYDTARLTAARNRPAPN